MPALEVDIANSANWELIHHSSHDTPMVSNITYRPIADIDVSGGILIDSPLIAVHAASATAKGTWHSAGFITQRTRIGVTVGGSPDADTSDSRRILLRKVKMVFWNRAIQNYQLVFRTHNWIRDLTIDVWKYTGPFIDPYLEEVQLARIDVLRTEKKVDSLFRNP